MDDAFERAAHREVVEQSRVGFRIHLAIYIGIQLMLVAIWWFTSDNGSVMPWFLFPLFGWGVGVLAHYLAVRPQLRRDATRRQDAT